MLWKRHKVASAGTTEAGSSLSQEAADRKTVGHSWGGRGNGGTAREEEGTAVTARVAARN